MKVSSLRYLFVSVLAIVGLMMMVGQMSAFAQSSNLEDQNATPRLTIKQQLFHGGFFQVIDAAIAPCSGQCVVTNWQTGACTCPQNFFPEEIARILIDAGTGPEGSICGSTLFACVFQQ